VIFVYGVGLVLGAMAIGALFWVVGLVAQILPLPVRISVFVVALPILLLREAGIVSLVLPQNARLVPLDVFHKGEYAGAMQFGFEMGTGARTYISSSAPYVLALVLISGLTGPIVAVALTVGFALGRLLMLLAFLASTGLPWWRDGSPVLGRRFGTTLTMIATISTLTLAIVPVTILGA